MVGELGERHALAGYALGGFLVSGAERGFHRCDVGSAHVVHDLASRGLFLRVQLHLRADVL